MIAMWASLAATALGCAALHFSGLSEAQLQKLEAAK